MNSNTPSFIMDYQISIGDINYGQHVGGDALVNIIHQARLNYLASLGSFSEISIAENIGLIITNLELHFKQQLSHNNKISIQTTVTEVKRSNFTITYYIFKADKTISHIAKTTLAFFDYQNQKLCSSPSIFMNIIKQEALKS